MGETLEALEQRRETQYRKLRDIGDLRRGLVSENFRKCGKPNCACAQEGHPGHGPQHLWNAAIEGTSHTPGVRRRISKVEDVVIAIKQLAAQSGVHKDRCDRELGYFEKNKERMRYAKFRSLGLFAGSGVLEAGCRSVIGQRLKQSGMHWTVEGANKIIALRCSIMSNRWEDFWEQRACA